MYQLAGITTRGLGAELFLLIPGLQVQRNRSNVFRFDVFPIRAFQKLFEYR